MSTIRRHIFRRDPRRSSRRRFFSAGQPRTANDFLFRAARELCWTKSYSARQSRGWPHRTPRSFGVIYTADLRSSPGRYDRVPVLVPTTNEAKNDLFNHPDILTEEQKKFRHTVCETLRELEAYDYTARVTNYKLALSLFPRMAERRNYTNEEQRRATDKIMDKLKEYTKQRGKYKPVLHGLWEMELPPGPSLERVKNATGRSRILWPMT